MLLATAVLLLQMPVFPAANASIGADAGVADAGRLYATAGPAESLFDKDHVRLIAPPPAGFAPAMSADKSVGNARVSRVSEETTVAEQLSEIHIPPRVEPLPEGFKLPPVRAVNQRSHMWLALGIAQHGAAAFDAWTTNRAVAQGRNETNPLLKPFAGSPSIYGAIQVGPAIFDYIGRRMQRSESPMMRRMWWFPQVLGMATSLYAGGYNLAHSR